MSQNINHVLPILCECHDCGCFSHVPNLMPGTKAVCPRCDGVLRREHRNQLDMALACNIAALLFYVLMVTTPFLEVRMYRMNHISTLQTGPYTLADDGFIFLASVVFLFSILMPLLKISIMLVVLLGLRLSSPPRWLYVPFRWMKRISPWAMIEVYLLGLFVAYTRLTALAQVDIGIAVYALAGLMIMMAAADMALDPIKVWEELEHRNIIHKHPIHKNTLDTGHRMGCHVCHRLNYAQDGASCVRCGSILHRRKLDSISRTWALTITAMMLYIPANIYPVMTITNLGQITYYTILGGISDLLKAGLWPLALLVFIASIIVPLIKLISLMLMLLTTHYGISQHLIDRTRLYRIIEIIGRWSMIDIFMLSILVALLQFGQLTYVRPGVGAIAFALVVVITMFASQGFDPRLMWDAAKKRKQQNVTCNNIALHNTVLSANEGGKI
jgi:paraquat-inducible protein A